MGHERVAVLDGGWNRWMSSGLPFDAAPVPPLPEEQGSFQGSPRRELVADLEEVIALLAARQGGRLIDARAPERFRGEMEPIDPVAGHIPGARNRPFALNLTLDGTFKQPEQLAEEFARLLDELPAADAVCYCGSGVTGAHLALAFRHAGLSMPRLYPGSWSEWITDPARPVALGD
jgi:thiosulfate/3-mercaptopyruvate sulfurtransferase